jgi:F-type H+-transporting ATPase subunit c
MAGLISNMLAVATDGSLVWTILGAVAGCAVVIVAASIGLATISSKASEAIARQPEAGGRIFLAMVVAAAMIEGFTFFALLICFMTIFWMRQ